MDMRQRILLVDDEPELRRMVASLLTGAGYEVLEAADCAQARAAMAAQRPDAVLLDVMLPDGDGFSLLPELRRFGDVPVLYLSARDEDAARLQGLGLGADDYITKPFNPLELTARVKSQLRRYTQLNPQSSALQGAKNEISIRGLVINKDNHKVTVYDEEIKLTPIEFDILYLLASNPGRVFSTDEIFEKVWNEKVYEANNTVMVHIRRLRGKMKEDTRQNKIITTVWGVGYKIEK